MLAVFYQNPPPPVGYDKNMRAINRPVSWWGWHWEPPVPMSIAELIVAGNLSDRLAAMLWVAMERGASVIVAADPPSAGKTTTLTALLSLTPPETLVYFTRGVGETFSLPNLSEAYPIYILINELSDHIPVYTWDDDARRAFHLLAQGYRLASTMHAATVDGVLGQLQGDLGIPPQHVAHLTLVLPLYVGRRGGIIRRVQEVAFLQPDAGGISVQTLAHWDPEADSFYVLPERPQREALAHWAGLTPQQLEDEIAERAAFFRRLIASGAAAIPQVNAAIEGWYQTRDRRRPPVAGEG